MRTGQYWGARGEDVYDGDADVEVGAGADRIWVYAFDALHQADTFW